MYKVTFIDGSQFDGGEPENTLWDMLPSKPISSIDCSLLDSTFHFENFEEYCSCVQKEVIIIPNQPGPKETIAKWIIMARIKERVYQVIFDLKRGCIYQLVTPWGQEFSHQERLGHNKEFLGYINGKPLTGWVIGILNTEYPGPRLKKIS